MADLKIEPKYSQLSNFKLAKSQYSVDSQTSSDPWSPDDVDKMDSVKFNDYKKLVKECRFYYRKDPISSTVINKLIEIGITDIVFDIGKLSENELRLFYALQDDLQKFAEDCALEYLITGLVVPETKFEAKPQQDYREYGIKKKSTINVPNLWIRDSSTIKMNSSFDGGEPSYFVEVPTNVVTFIQQKGRYEDGTVDIKKYEELLKLYPAFVSDIHKGITEFLLENNLIIRRKPLPDSPYPTPYIYSALENLKHKRNLKRLDYSIAARAIGAIQQFRVGNDEFPATEDQSDIFENLKEQMSYRNSQKADIERIFQLFTNHTVEIEWIFPPLDSLLDDKKYTPVNEDIFFALGFPRILTTGETGRSNTSDPEFASMSPVKTMYSMQKAILSILKGVVKQIAIENGLSEYPNIRFEPISLHNFADFITGLRNLYDTGNLSRTTFAGAFGYNFSEEAQQLEKDKKLMKSYGLEEFAPRPFSPQPGGQTNEKPKGKTSTTKPKTSASTESQTEVDE